MAKRKIIVYVATSADGFIARNSKRYEFYVITPPGLNGTPARPLPPETTSYGELTWTRRLERDILDLINRGKLSKPVIVTHGFPGSLAAHELAAQHADTFGGVIDIAAIPLQLFPSPKDPSGRTPSSAGTVATISKNTQTAGMHRTIASP